MQDFQSIAAPAVVILAVILLGYFSFKKKGSCCGTGSCSSSPESGKDGKAKKS